MKNIIVDIGNTHVGFLFINKDNQSEVIICHFKQEIVKAQKRIYEQLNGETGFLLISSVNSFFLKEVKGVFSDTKVFSIEVLHSEEFIFRIKELGFTIPNIDYLATDLMFDILSCEGPTLVADYGTASKLLFIDSKLVFQGGMIGAGLKSINRSLSASAELLDEFSLEVPEKYMSYQTKDAINDSSIYGECFKIIGLFNRLKLDYKEPALRFIITGGDSHFLSLGLTKLGFKDFTYDPQHIFKGMLKALKMDAKDLKGIE